MTSSHFWPHEALSSRWRVGDVGQVLWWGSWSVKQFDVQVVQAGNSQWGRTIHRRSLVDTTSLHETFGVLAFGDPLFSWLKRLPAIFPQRFFALPHLPHYIYICIHVYTISHQSFHQGWIRRDSGKRWHAGWTSALDKILGIPNWGCMCLLNGTVSFEHGLVIGTLLKKLWRHGPIQRILFQAMLQAAATLEVARFF